nr:hypothetical protein [Tanacetum cinerariifolium]
MSPPGCLALLGYGQSLGVLPSLSAASESGSHVTTIVSRLVYSATVVVPGVPEVGTPVHILAREGSKTHDVLSGLTLPIEPKPRGQHRPPPPRSILSPRESSYLPSVNRLAVSPWQPAMICESYYPDRPPVKHISLGYQAHGPQKAL